MAIRRYDFTATFNDKDMWDINPPFVNTASSVYIRQIRGSRIKISIESGEQIFSFDSENGLGFVLPPFNKLRIEYRDKTANRVEEVSLYVSDVPGGIQDNRLVVNDGTATVPVAIQDQPVEVYFDASNPIPVDIQNQPVEVTGEGGGAVPVAIQNQPIQVTEGPDGSLPVIVLGAVEVFGIADAPPAEDINVRVRNAPSGGLDRGVFFRSDNVTIPDTGNVGFTIATASFPYVLYYPEYIFIRFIGDRTAVQHRNGELQVTTYTTREGGAYSKFYYMRAKDALSIEDENVVSLGFQWEVFEPMPTSAVIAVTVYIRYSPRE